MKRERLLPLGEIAEAYLQIITDSKIADIDKISFVSDIKTNLQNMRNTMNNNTTRTMRSKVTDAYNDQYTKLSVLQKLIETFLNSSDAGQKSAAEKIMPAFGQKLSAVKKLTANDRNFYYKLVQSRLAEPELKPALELLKLQTNAENFINSVKAHTTARNEFLIYCKTLQETSNASHHKKLLAESLRNFEKLVDLKTKEPNSTQWCTLREYLAKYIQMFYQRQQSDKTPESGKTSIIPETPAVEKPGTSAQSA